MRDPADRVRSRQPRLGATRWLEAQGPGLLIDIDFDRAQAKIVPTGQILVIGTTPDGPLYLEGFVIDPSFPAFANCAKLEL